MFLVKAGSMRWIATFILVAMVEARMGSVRQQATSGTTTVSLYKSSRIRVPIERHQVPHPFYAQPHRRASADQQHAANPQYLKRDRKFRSPFPQRTSSSDPHPSHSSAAPSSGPGSAPLGLVNGNANNNQSTEIELTPDYRSIVYTGVITVGTPHPSSHLPPQNFSCVFDTGSADLWVFSAQTTAPKQSYLHYYDHAQSSTWVSGGNKPWHIEYGRGSCEGVYSIDSVTLGPYRVTGQSMCEGQNRGEGERGRELEPGHDGCVALH